VWSADEPHLQLPHRLLVAVLRRGQVALPAAAATDPFVDKINRERHIREVTLPRVQPIIPTRRKEPFDDPEWLFEFKYDGFRALCYLDQGGCRFVSRNGNVLSDSRLTAAPSR
jgi:ATP-dependent DNA ligase